MKFSCRREIARSVAVLILADLFISCEQARHSLMPSSSTSAVINAAVAVDSRYYCLNDTVLHRNSLCLMSTASTATSFTRPRPEQSSFIAINIGLFCGRPLGSRNKRCPPSVCPSVTSHNHGLTVMRQMSRSRLFRSPFSPLFHYSGSPRSGLCVRIAGSDCVRSKHHFTQLLSALTWVGHQSPSSI